MDISSSNLNANLESTAFHLLMPSSPWNVSNSQVSRKFSWKGLLLSRRSYSLWFMDDKLHWSLLLFSTGSAWTALSRSFVEYCIWGYDNLPRVALMYYANFISSPEGYFHTVICNAPEFRNTTVNHDLHFISWDNPPQQHPHHLGVDDMQRMVDSNAPFARKFARKDPVLDIIDEKLLSRNPGMLVPGGWCLGPSDNQTDPCLVVGNLDELRPGPGAVKLDRLVNILLSQENFRPRQCK